MSVLSASKKEKKGEKCAHPVTFNKSRVPWKQSAASEARCTSRLVCCWRLVFQRRIRSSQRFNFYQTSNFFDVQSYKKCSLHSILKMSKMGKKRNKASIDESQENTANCCIGVVMGLLHKAK